MWGAVSSDGKRYASWCRGLDLVSIVLALSLCFRWCCIVFCPSIGDLAKCVGSGEWGVVMVSVEVVRPDTCGFGSGFVCFVAQVLALWLALRKPDCYVVLRSGDLAGSFRDDYW